MLIDYHNCLLSFNNVLIVANILASNYFDQVHYCQKAHTKALYNLGLGVSLLHPLGHGPGGSTRHPLSDPLRPILLCLLDLCEHEKWMPPSPNWDELSVWRRFQNGRHGNWQNHVFAYISASMGDRNEISVSTPIFLRVRNSIKAFTGFYDFYLTHDELPVWRHFQNGCRGNWKNHSVETSHESLNLDNAAWNALSVSSNFIGQMLPIPLNALVCHSEWIYETTSELCTLLDHTPLTDHRYLWDFCCSQNQCQRGFWCQTLKHDVGWWRNDHYLDYGYVLSHNHALWHLHNSKQLWCLSLIITLQ